MAIEKIKILGAEYSFYLKSIATYAPAFWGYNNSVLARVACLELLLLSVSKLRFVIINYEKPSTCPTLSSTHSVTLEKRHYRF